MDLDAPDYLDSSETVIRKASEILGQSPGFLRNRATLVRDDVLRIRISYGMNRDGLPLAFAGSLVAGTQKLLKAAACTVIKPRIHHPRLTLTDSVQLIEHCNFEHTEAGSFVVKVSCPVAALDVEGELQLDLGPDFLRPPFVRRVMFTLHDGVAALIHAVERDQLEQLVESVRQSSAPTLSSNFCEALLLLQDNDLDNSADLAIDWSASVPTPTRYQNRVLRVQKDYFSRIEAVRRELRSSEHQHEDTYVGTVERLDGEMSDDGARSGEVVLVLLPMEGESIKVRTSLNVEQYRIADRAHMTDGAYVRVRGLLRPGRQPRQLANLSLFELLDPIEFSDNP